MKLKLLLLYFFCSYISMCTISEQKQIDARLIRGCWKISGNEISFVSLSFSSDSLAVFLSRADTMYRFKYLVSKDLLILQDGNEQYKCPINFLSKDSFSFKDVVVNQRILSYTKDTCRN